MLSAFVTLYKLDAPQWSSIEQLTKALNWTEMVSLTATEFFLDNGVSERFIHEQIEAGTLVNYAQVGLPSTAVFQRNSTMQSTDDLHAGVAICSLVAGGGVSVKGGNWRIFEQFVEQSGARIFLKTEVSLRLFLTP